MWNDKILTGIVHFPFSGGDVSFVLPEHLLMFVTLTVT